ncbi:AsnC family protein [Kitasatospora sp. NPDC048540]|uniref:AsnC family protein n=1 Tax=Kitasatospora sp. NPDC048540 TaxID=3155634 RepID=UPI0033D31B83
MLRWWWSRPTDAASECLLRGCHPWSARSHRNGPRAAAGWAELAPMARASADSVPSSTDQRLVAALQCDGRVTAERAAQVLGTSAATVRRRLQALGDDGTVRVVISPVARPRGGGASGARPCACRRTGVGVQGWSAGGAGGAAGGVRRGPGG